MEFLKALNEAQQFGVSKEDFIKIWELEIKLKQQKEEVKALELKSACNQAQELTNLQEIGYQMKLLLENNQNLQKQQISQLKENLLQETRQLKENLLQETRQLKESLLQENKAQLKETLLQETRQFKDTLLQETRQLKESLLQENKAQLKETLLQETRQFKDTLLQENKAQLKETLLQETCQFKDTLVQQISQLKESLLHENKAQFQETSKLLENQMNVTAVIVKYEVTELLNQFATTMKSELLQACMDMSKSGQSASASNDVQRSEDFQEKPLPDQVHLKVSFNLPDSHSDESDSDESCIEDGIFFYVHNLENIAASQRVLNSPDYRIPDLPIIVYLTMWFNQTGNMRVELSLSGETGEALETCMVFTITGFIKNRNSGSFSSLFEGTSQPLRKPKLNKAMKVKTTVCLSTGSGSYDDVTFDELDRRGFVINDSCTIKWFVKSREV